MAMKAPKPALALTASMAIWIGNTSQEVQTFGPMELYGFSTGSFEECYLPRSLARFLFMPRVRWIGAEVHRNSFPHP